VKGEWAALLSYVAAVTWVIDRFNKESTKVSINILDRFDTTLVKVVMYQTVFRTLT